MSVSVDPKRIDELMRRGVEEIIQTDSLRTKLESGKQLRVKLGIDPTSPDLHIGRAVPLLKLRDFQELGHQIVFIVGDFTGLIGDTSDKESERPMLTKETVAKNMKSYKEQVGKILDVDKAEVHNNSTWLASLTYREIGEHADQFSVADFIARENIKKRLKGGKRVSLREMLYPLLQGYDSIAVNADVEIGGTDQRFNLLAGRTLQEHFGKPPQDIIMGPLVSGLDGRKMSASWGNTINLTATPEDMYGKIMSMHDADIMSYFEYCTRIAPEEVERVRHALDRGENPRDIKMQLAREIVTLYHSKETAEKAKQTFIGTFQRGEIPEDVEVIERQADEQFTDALVRLGVADSKRELQRLVDAGGVRNAESGEKLVEIPKEVPKPVILKVGKRRFVKLMPR